MKTILAMALCLTTFSAIAQINPLKVSISPWLSSCNQKHCKTPVPTHLAKTYQVEVKLLEDEGSADVSTTEFHFLNDRSGSLNLYSVFPKISSGNSPYIQFQFIQKSPVYLFCAHSIKLVVPLNVPPLLCATEFENNRLGYTITFE